MQILAALVALAKAFPAFKELVLSLSDAIKAAEASRRKNEKDSAVDSALVDPLRVRSDDQAGQQQKVNGPS